ncbi:unnamed protein product [Paramecium sonneborni]|uniref:Transmembrane protein n=1 Tax=Paramecium sonneborni TaxID=65129 RepID=A0A8S1MS42_9CILI|nr:unnamed protein product [Paramecium sonneborni]
MLNNIGYLAYISIMGILLLISPSSFIKITNRDQEQSLFNTQLSSLLQTESGLRICGFYHLILLFAQISKQERVKFICLNIYALFLISRIDSLCIDGVGQIQSERLERLGFYANIQFYSIQQLAYQQLREEIFKE